MLSKKNGKAFHDRSFFINNKRNGKNFMVKYIQYVHNFTVVPKYKNIFLHSTSINISWNSILVSIISINISWNSFAF